MRAFNSTFGMLTVPIAWYTAKTLKFSREACIFVTAMVLCENSMTTISRFILLDSMLLFFTTTSMLCLAKIHSLRNDSFSPSWWLWMFLTGISLGSAGSVKWIGAFSVTLVGIYTVDDLWNKLGDLSISKKTYAMHWVARIITLIIVPFIIYALSFYLHFLILVNSGPGDSQMSSLFQANLNGSDLRNSPLEVAFGSRITLKNAGYGGGLLHSHVQLYPEGSGQQQVTCYHHKDANNEWFITPPHGEAFDFNATDIRFIKDKSVIRLVHASTGRNLHSHKVPAPITKSEYEVSCYGNMTVGDEKDHFIVEVVSDSYRARDRIRTLTTTFRLRHKSMGCYLRAANVNLPQWGFKQIEVTCAPNRGSGDSASTWNIERQWNQKLPMADVSSFQSPFWKDFVHINVAMKASNDALVPNPDKIDKLTSKAWQWPILKATIRMCSWSKDTIKYLLIGNPLIVWGSTFSIAMSFVLVAVYFLRWQRHYVDFTPEEIDHIHYSGLYPLLGYCIHYFPFYVVGRVLYMHHYIPVLYFGVFVLGFFLDFITRKLDLRTKRAVFFVATSAVVFTFIFFRAATFGMQGK